METIIKEVSPVEAAEMLKRNKGNRKLSDSHVNFLARQMKFGKWMFDGQPIRITPTGRVLDGQHRLNALIQSDTSQKFLIVKGVQDDAFTVMDTGKNRSAGDVLGVKGYSNPSHLSASVKIIINHLNNRNGGSRTDRHKASNVDVLNFVNDNPSIVHILNASNNHYRAFNKILSKSQIAAFMFIMAERNVSDSERFWEGLCYGDNLSIGSPIKVLREILIRDKMSKSNLPFQEKKALIFKAWNHFRKGTEDMKYIRWDKNREKFPTLL